MRQYFFLAFMCSTFLFAVSMATHAAVPSNTSGNTPGKTPGNTLMDIGLTETCSPEPIFKGVACIYEANKDAKETIVLVHGLNANAASWISQIAAFKESYHIVTFDLPGFGKSSRGNKLYSPTNYAKFIRHVTTTIVGRPFYLVGHSMGGAISLRYSAMYPNDIKRLVLADVGGVLHQYSYAKSIGFKWLKLVQNLTSWAFPSLLDLPGVDEMANVLFQQLEWLPIDIRDALRVPELRAIILSGNSISIAGAAVSTENLSGALRNNQIPTLIVWGGFDLVTPIRTGKILQVRMPHSYLRVLPRSAHSPMYDQPNEFNLLMLEHLIASNDDLENTFWKPQQFKHSEKIGRCSKGERKVFEGNYLRIELNNCSKAFIRNANIGSIISRNSEIEILNSQFETDDIAIVLFDSSLEMSASNVSADIAIQTVRSHIDVAGVDFKTTTAVVNSFGYSDAVFSVSTVNGKYLHRYKDLSLEGRL